MNNPGKKEKCTEQKKIKIRKACLEDCRDIYRWKNDKTTRESSFNSKTIPFEEHLNWYRQAIGDHQKKIFIGENSVGVKIGMIRFDEMSANTYKVNVNMAPEHRNKGLGSLLIAKASQIVGGKILAKIKINNPGSIQAFQKGGYVEVRNKNGVVFMEYRNYGDSNVPAMEQTPE